MSQNREHFDQCLKVLLQHLEQLRPILNHRELDGRAVEMARKLIIRFVLSESSTVEGRRIFYCYLTKDGEPCLETCNPDLGAMHQGLWDDELKEMYKSAGYNFVGTVLDLLLNFTRDMPARERAEAARELCDEASDLVERFTGKSWESPQATATGGKSESAAPPGSHTHNDWLHDAGSEPPAEFYCEKWLTGTQAEIGFAIRPANQPPVKTDVALRDYLERIASAKNSRVWCRAAGTRQIEAFVRDTKTLHAAEDRLVTYRAAKPKKVKASQKKSVPQKGR